MDDLHSWLKEFPGAVTVSDRDGTIVAMNDKAAQSFEEDGGYALIGKNVLDCHPTAAREKLEKMMDTQQTNIYTIEKHSVKKLVYQTPWYKDGHYMGFVELVLEIPFEMPHFIRK